MKSVDAGQFAANVAEFLHASQTETIVVTQGGKPCAVINGLSFDEEQMALVNSREFWSMIETRRGQRTIPWSTVKQQLDPPTNEPTP
jgi:hypothetical protein